MRLTMQGFVANVTYAIVVWATTVASIPPNVALATGYTAVMLASAATTLMCFSALVSREDAFAVDGSLIVLNGLTFIVVAAGCYAVLGFGDDGVGGEGFGDAIYFSTITFTTVGYGDFQPGPWSRPIAMVQAIAGYLYLGMLVGVGSRLVQKDRKADHPET